MIEGRYCLNSERGQLEEERRKCVMQMFMVTIIESVWNCLKFLANHIHGIVCQKFLLEQEKEKI